MARVPECLSEKGFAMRGVREWGAGLGWNCDARFTPQKKPIEQKFYRLYTSLRG